MELLIQVTNDEFHAIGLWLLKHKASGFDEFERKTIEKFLDSVSVCAEEAQVELEREAAEEIDFGHFNFQVEDKIA